MEEQDQVQFPTQGQIDRRADEIIGGIGYPFMPALPGVAFRRLTLAERGEASRAYSKFLKDDMAKGGRFSEPLLPTELRRRCLEVGIDYDELMEVNEEFQRRIFEQAPPELKGTKRLTDEEITALPDEARAAYIAQLKAQAAAIESFMKGLFTPEEQIVRAQIDQVKVLRYQLQSNTYEHHARTHQLVTEILAGARQADDLDCPYFASADDLYELQDTDQETFLTLVAKWGEFKQGRWPGFTQRSSSTPTPGGK